MIQVSAMMNTIITYSCMREEGERGETREGEREGVSRGRVREKEG